MARPIGETPTLYGEEACEFLREMKKPPNKKQIDAGKRLILLNERYYLILNFNFLGSISFIFESKSNVLIVV